MLKAFKTEIAPTEGQKAKIIRSIGVARFLYNQYIAYNRRLYKMYQRGMLDEKQKRFVTANDFDRDLATRFNFVRIEGDKAIYANHWMAGGNEITWDMVHYDVQLFGGVVLHKGKIAEIIIEKVEE